MSGSELRQYQIPINYNTSEESISETTNFISSPSRIPTPVPITTTPSQPRYTSGLSRPASLRSLVEIRQVQLPDPVQARSHNVRSQTDFEPCRQFICNGTQTEFVVSPTALEKLSTSVEILQREFGTIVPQLKQHEQSSTAKIRLQLDFIQNQLSKISATKVRFSDSTRVRTIQDCQRADLSPRHASSSFVTCQILSPICLFCMIIITLQAVTLALIYQRW